MWRDGLEKLKTGDVEDLSRRAKDVLSSHNLVLVGLMGAGKSVIGKLLAEYTGLPFVDSDDEIVKAAQMSVNEIFESYGEPEFRALEARVVRRVLDGGPQIVSTGGGAFMNEETRRNILQNSLSVWLRADFDVLWNRVSKRTTRPLLKQPNPKQILKDLMAERYPVYEQADLTVQSQNVPKWDVASRVLETIIENAQLVDQKFG